MRNIEENKCLRVPLYERPVSLDVCEVNLLQRSWERVGEELGTCPRRCPPVVLHPGQYIYVMLAVFPPVE